MRADRFGRLKMAFGICVILLGCMAGISFAGIEAQAKEGAYTPETDENFRMQCYQEFLDGKRTVHVDGETEGVRGRLVCGWLIDEHMASVDISIMDIVKNADLDARESYGNERIRMVRYAYLDCGADGTPELALQFQNMFAHDDMRTTLIIVCENGELYVRHAYDTAPREWVTLSYYGRMDGSGSSGAQDTDYEEAYLDSGGRKQTVWHMDIYAKKIAAMERNLGVKIFDEEEFEGTLYASEIYMRIGDSDEFYEGLFTDRDVDEEQWETFYRLYEEQKGRLYTKEELEWLCSERRKELGITKRQMSDKMPEWHALLNPVYQEYVYEIERMEHNKSRKPLENGERWIFPARSVSSYEGELSYKEKRGGIELSGNNWKWMGDVSFNAVFQSAIQYVLADYCESRGISDKEWEILAAGPQGEGLYTVTVCSDGGRKIRFLLDGETIEDWMEEYTEYIVLEDILRSHCYQEFLDGKRTVRVELQGADESPLMPYDFIGIGALQGQDVSLMDILRNAAECAEYEGDSIETVSYAYLDCGADGEEELAVSFCTMAPDHETTTVIIACEKDTLSVRCAYDSWSRCDVVLSYYGQVRSGGSSGARAHGADLGYLDGHGRIQMVYSVFMEEEEVTHIAWEVGSELLEGEQISDTYLRSQYDIGGREYIELELLSDEDVEETQWETLYRLYEEQNGKLYTDEEIDNIIGRRIETLGITDKQKEKQELSWEHLQNRLYKDYVYEIFLWDNHERRVLEERQHFMDR